MIVPDLSHLWFAAGTGFVMGLRHAADADHVVAVSTIVSRSRRLSGAWRVGAAWGLGHTLTFLIAGAAVVGLRRAMPEGLTQGLERGVGAMLVLLGAAALAGWRGGVREHSHSHAHGETHGHHLQGGGEHSHAHVHVPELDALTRTEPLRLGRSFLVGMFHGLEGSSALSLALLAALPGLGSAALYLVVFGAGTLAGMTMLSAAFSLSVIRLGRVAGLDRWLAPGVGALSVAMGFLILGGWSP